MSAATVSSRFTALAIAGSLAVAASPRIVAAADAGYDVAMIFGGLVAYVPRPAAAPAPALPSGWESLSEFWVLAPLAEDRDVLLNASSRARNGAQLPVQEPNRRHYAFLRAGLRDLIRGGCGDHPDPRCEAAAAAAPDTRVWIPLGASDPLHPTPGARARYDLSLETSPSPAPSALAMRPGTGIGAVQASTTEVAQACAGCTSFASPRGSGYTPPAPVQGLEMPLAFRIGFRTGETVAVGSDRLVVVRHGATGATRLVLTPRDKGPAPPPITLRPASSCDYLVLEIVNATGDEIAGAGLSHDDPQRMEHFKLLYLLAPRPGNGFVYDYAQYVAPPADAHAPPQVPEYCPQRMKPVDTKATLGFPGFPFTTDPFCTKPGQMKPPPSP